MYQSRHPIQPVDTSVFARSAGRQLQSGLEKTAIRPIPATTSPNVKPRFPAGRPRLSAHLATLIIPPPTFHHTYVHHLLITRIHQFPRRFYSFTDSRQQKDWLDLTIPCHNPIVFFSGEASQSWVSLILNTRRLCSGSFTRHAAIGTSPAKRSANSTEAFVCNHRKCFQDIPGLRPVNTMHQHRPTLILRPRFNGIPRNETSFTSAALRTGTDRLSGAGWPTRIIRRIQI